MDTASSVISAETDPELVALRAELRLRITVQNGLLFFATALFSLFFALLLGWPEQGWLVALGHTAASLSCALQWGHHGVRTKQLKAYILRKEAAYCSAGSDSWESWETWLPGQRPATLLGGRWFISTKGVMIGLQGAMIVAALLGASFVDGRSMMAAGLSLGLFGVTVWYLLTNPKE